MQVRDTTTRRQGARARQARCTRADVGLAVGLERALRCGRDRPRGGAVVAFSQEPRPFPAPAGTVILELSKEKTNERLLDRQAAAFTASVQHVEAELSAQIRYLTQVATGQPHEGSSYSSRKDCQMALKRVDYARLKLSDVARTCEQMLEN